MASLASQFHREHDDIPLKCPWDPPIDAQGPHPGRSGTELSESTGPCVVLRKKHRWGSQKMLCSSSTLFSSISHSKISWFWLIVSCWCCSLRGSIRVDVVPCAGCYLKVGRSVKRLRPPNTWQVVIWQLLNLMASVILWWHRASSNGTDFNRADETVYLHDWNMLISEIKSCVE